MTPDQMKETYLSHMINVFPENELKPCDSIYADMLKGKFLACGLYAGEELLGYVFSACMPGRKQLFGQYVVVKEEYRSMGIGGIMMDKVMEHYSDYTCFMADVEDPDRPVDVEDKTQRERRMRFYTRNGFRRTKVKAYVYGVDYEVIVRDISNHADDIEVYESANAIYESMAYPGTFPEMFQVRLQYDKQDRGMNRREFKKLNTTRLQHKHIETEGFTGIAGKLDIIDTDGIWNVDSVDGEVTIAAPGYTWLQLLPDNNKWWLTVMYDTNNELVQYYFDIIDSAYISGDGEPRFKDLFIDIVMSADGKWRLLDENELETAFKFKAITGCEYARAKEAAEEITHMIDGKEHVLRNICLSALEQF